MPFANFTGTGNGSTTQFQIPFPYVKKDHIVVALDYVANTNFTFVNDTTIQFSSLSSATATQETTGAPKAGVVIEISRDTPLLNALVDFVDGSTLTAGDLDTAVLQLLYGLQEAKDEAALGVQFTPQGQDAKNKPIINVSDPTNAQDAVTKAFLERVGSITSTQIADGSIVNADVNASAAIDGTKISPDFGSQNIATSGTVDGRDVSADGTKLDGIESGATADQTNAEIKTAYLANSDTNNLTDLLLAKLNGIEANATTDQTIAEIKSLIAGSPLDASHLAPDSVSTSEIANSSVTNAKLADAELVTLSGMPSGTASKLASSTELTSDIADLNQIDGLQKETVISDDDTKFPTSGAIVDYVAAQLAPIGGLEAIANENSFPNTQPQSGVVISIADAGGMVVSSTGTASGQTVGGTTVNITGIASNFNSSTVAAGIRFLVVSTGSGQNYTYHKATLKEDDLVALSGDINDFGERYRVGSTNPTTNNDSGDLFWNTSTGKLMVYNGTSSAWEEAQSIGNFFISTLSPAFDGTTADFTITNAPTSAQQILLIIEGVIQKPNSGTSTPSEGFALTGSTVKLAAAPPVGASYFAVVMGSAVNIGTPSNNTVTEAILQSNVVSEEKLKVSNSPVNGYFLQAQSGNSGGLTWAEAVNFTTLTEHTGADANGNSAGDLIFEGTDTDSSGSVTDDDRTKYDKSLNTFNLGRNVDVNIGFLNISTKTAATNFNNGHVLQYSAHFNMSTGADIWFSTVGKRVLIGTSDTANHEVASFQCSALGASQHGFAKLNYVIANAGGSTSMQPRLLTTETGMTFTGVIVPAADSTHDLGTNTVRWRNMYADTYYGDGSNLTGVSSAEVYGFNTDSNGNLIVTTTNGGVDNISGTDYDNFEDVIFAATGFTFSVNANGKLIATV